MSRFSQFDRAFKTGAITSFLESPPFAPTKNKNKIKDGPYPLHVRKKTRMEPTKDWSRTVWSLRHFSSSQITSREGERETEGGNKRIKTMDIA